MIFFFKQVGRDVSEQREKRKLGTFIYTTEVVTYNFLFGKLILLFFIIVT